MNIWRKVLLGVCFFTISSQSLYAEIILRLTENQPEGNPVTVAMHLFSDLVNEYSNGEISVRVYSGAQLGQETESIEQAQFGIGSER